MRRLATLLAVEDVGQLVEFLRPADSARTQQSALQGICNIFEAAGPPADELGRSALCRRVHELAEKCLDPDVVASPQTAVKGALAIAAAVALGDPDLEQLAIRLSRCGRRALERSVARLLTQVYEGWQRRLASGDPFPPAFGRLRVVLAQLLPLPKEKTGTET
ncbi:MAG: hypothetical protein HYZ53_08695 [Planctomycetes bacterium]|nr:hypothetical protein [Planctomycetota bacterium]